MAENNLTALKKFFGADRPLSMAELKALSKDERADLADQIFEVTGWERVTGP